MREQSGEQESNWNEQLESEEAENATWPEPGSEKRSPVKILEQEFKLMML